MRWFFLIALVTFALAGPARAARPNFLFVLVDDMGYADLSCFGGKDARAQTPNIDRLAAEGIRFTQFYVNSPICSPSRTALLTGQYPQRWKITSYLSHRDEDRKRGMADWLSTDAPSLARILHDAGYHTAHVGKWHMGGQRDVGDAPPITAYGFDTSLTNFEGLGERILPKFTFKHEPTETSAKLGEPIRWVERTQVTKMFCDRAIEEIGHAAAANKPFYINLWPDDVHTPCVPDYLTVLVEMDKQLERVFEHIRSNPKLRENTVIILASDNGHESGVGSGGSLRGSKGQLYEGGIRSPLIVWGAKTQATTNDTTLIAGMDLAPTVLAIAKVEVPKDVKFDGLDMSAACSKDAKARSSPIFWSRPPDRPGPKGEFPDLAVRDGKWKLLIERDGSRAQLFDIPAAPDEKNDVAAEHRDVVDRLSKLVRGWDRELKATNPSGIPASRTSAPRDRS
jgi:uncharacterized sulfatase